MFLQSHFGNTRQIAVGHFYDFQGFMSPLVNPSGGYLTIYGLLQLLHYCYWPNTQYEAVAACVFRILSHGLPYLRCAVLNSGFIIQSPASGSFVKTTFAKTLTVYGFVFSAVQRHWYLMNSIFTVLFNAWLKLM